jgi:hypothetical protein
VSYEEKVKGFPCDLDRKTVDLSPAFRGIELKSGNELKLHKDEDLAAAGEIGIPVMYEGISKKGNTDAIPYFRRA